MYKPPFNTTWFCVGPSFGRLIYDLMISNLFYNVLEIGSAEGYSTHSFISALKNGSNFKFTICDVRIQDSVRKMIKNHPEVRVEQKRSIEVIDKKFDFIFVDGNHDICTVSEEILKILDCNTKTILAHDTFINHHDFRGSVLLHKVFYNNKNYYCVYHNKRKKEDQTHYGISFFTQDKKIYEYAKKMFNKIDKFIKFY